MTKSVQKFHPFQHQSIKLMMIAVLFFISPQVSFSLGTRIMSSSTKLCQFESLSQHVYVINGSNTKTCPPKTLKHPVTNPVAIIGDLGVIIIDPGNSEAVGKLVVDRLKLITKKPVIAIINTHIHGLYWLGNHAIKQAFPNAVIYAHSKMIKRIKQGEGRYWLETITAGESGIKTQLVDINKALNGGETLALNGVLLKIHHPIDGHTDHDLLIEIVEDKILVMGGIVVEPEVPSQGVPKDAKFKAQIAATEFAIALKMTTYIPGQGFPQGIKLPQRALHFLKALYSGVEFYYQQDLTDFEVTKKLKHDLVKFQQWYDFDALGRVIAEMYLQVEADNF